MMDKCCDKFRVFAFTVTPKFMCLRSDDHDYKTGVAMSAILHASKAT